MRSKKILVVIADYAPHVTSTTICIEPYLLAMEKAGIEITILTRRVDFLSPKIEKVSSLRTVIRVDDFRMMVSNRLKKAEKVKGAFSRLLMRIISVVVRGFLYALYSIGNYETYAAGWSVRKIDKVLKQLSGEKLYDYVMSISFPAKTHEIIRSHVKKYCSDSKWLLMEYDPFCYNTNYKGRSSFKRLFMIQSLYFSECYKILVTPQLMAFYKRSPLNEYSNKMLELEYSNFHEIDYDKNKVNPIEFKDNKRIGLFCGVIRSDIRPLSKLVNIARFLPDDIVIYLMTGSSLKEWESELKAAKNKIKVIDRQNKDTAIYAMSKAHFLVNIGNTVQFQVPGKLFEYMSIRKPIVHISSMKDDPCAIYLNQYPLSLFIDVEELPEEGALRVVDFLDNSVSSDYSFEDIKECMTVFNSENTTQRLVDFILNN